MRDITFEDTNGFPIFRSEKVGFVRRAIEEQQTQQEEITPAWERQPRAKAQTFDLHPDIPMADRHTFDLKAFELEEVGKKARFRRNVEAIRILKECEFDNRFATPEEQQVLAQYVGWGGIPEAFDENNTAWADEFTELYGLLSPEEYQSARESTLTAFYTPPVVISAIYKAMEQMGFKEGNILERPAVSVTLSVCCRRVWRTAVFTVWRLIRFPQVSHSSSISVPLLPDSRLRKRISPTAFLTQL